MYPHPNSKNSKFGENQENGERVDLGGMCSLVGKGRGGAVEWESEVRLCLTTNHFGEGLILYFIVHEEEIKRKSSTL